MHSVAHQDEVGIRSRLFQRLEQGIRRVGVHAVRRCEDDHLAISEPRRLVGKCHHLPNLVDLDNPAFVLGGQPPHIAMATAGAQGTGVAFTAVQAVRGPLAQQPPRQRQGETLLADMPRTRKQQGMGQPLALDQRL